MPIRALLVVFLLAAAAGCESDAERRLRWENERLDRERVAWAAPCSDESVLLATTAGSPSEFRCPNREHRMQVQPMTVASKEEAAALVFCRCERAQSAKAGQSLSSEATTAPM